MNQAAEEHPAPKERLLAAGHNLVNDLVTREVIEGLRARGTRPILLKGSSVRRLLYALDEERISNDIDLLIEAVELTEVEDALPMLGFRYFGVARLGAGRRGERWWLHEPTGLFVELHTTITGIGASPTIVWETLAANTETVKVDGSAVEILDEVGRIFHVVLNAAKHGRRDAKTMADLERALSLIPVVRWREAAGLALRLDALSSFSAGLRLDPRGVVLLEKLGVDAPVDPIDALRAETAPPLAEGIEWFMQLPSARARAEFLLRTVVPPPQYMRYRSPRARKGRLGLATAYLGRPFWIAAHLRPAIQAWRRARQTARASKLGV